MRAADWIFCGSVAAVAAIVTLPALVGSMQPVQTVTEQPVPPVIRPGRPMLARWDNGCRIVIVECVGDVENERPDRVWVRWPAEDGDGQSWYYGWSHRSRLEPLEK